MRIVTLAGVIIVLLLWPAVLWAGTITGRVTGQAGDRPLASVTVLLTGPGVFEEAQTDSTGQYRIPDLSSGAYRLEFFLEGFKPLQLEAELQSDQPLTLDAVLILDAFELDEMIVTGSAAEAEMELQTGYLNLDNETLSLIPSVIEPDPLRALQILPGVQAASDISSGLYIRGGGPDQNLVMMDGVTVYNPTHAFGFFSTFNNDMVEDVDLYKGAYPAQYGGRLGAVVDVSMKQPDAEEFGGKAGISLIAARVYLEGKLGQDHWQIGGRRSYLDPILKALRTEENPIPDYFFYDMNAAYSTSRGGGLTTFQLYNGTDNISVDAQANTAFDINWGNTVAALHHERSLSESLDGRLVLSNSRYRSSTDAKILATGFDIENKLNDFTAAAYLDWWAGYNHRLHFGTAYSLYDFLYSQSFNQTPQVDYRSKPTEWATFVEDQWFADDLTTLRTGLRYRYISDGKRSLLEPRLSVSRRVIPQLRLKLGAGIYNQYLQLVATEGFSAGDFYLPVDDSAEMGRSLQLVVGGDWQATAKDQISLETYVTDLDNLLEFDTRTPVDQAVQTADGLFVTDGKGYARGVELFVRHKEENWTGWFGYTLGWASRTFADLNNGEAFRPKYDRRHDINALFSVKLGNWNLASSFRYATGQAFTPAAARYELGNPAIPGDTDSGRVLSASRNSGRLLPYHRLDVSARRPISLFGLPAELVLEVFNLYNRRNEWYVQYETDDEVTEATVVRQLPLIPSVGVNFEF
jgi:Carboxypeptidase regulatory-like domain/TonB-dependent Receptor Plug Domain